MIANALKDNGDVREIEHLPVIINNKMPDIMHGSIPIVLANLERGYLMSSVRGGHIRFIEDNNGYVVEIILYINGGVLQKEAFKAIKYD